MIDRYILNDENEPEPCDDLLTWARWLEGADRIVLQTTVGGAHVSTVFLGVNFRHFGNGAPLLWETMIFGGRFHQYCCRYTSQLAAMRGHVRAVGLVELSDDAPRKLKKALRKGAAYRLRPRERQRVKRALTRIEALA